ncbi:MAG: DinB family protein [Gemmatimonadota bacterium]
MSRRVEAWLRGPVEGVPPHLMPVAHALMHAVEDTRAAAAALNAAQLWQRPAGAASVGFHLRHTAGALDRLLTYARGEALSEAQLAALKVEGEPGDPAADAAHLLAALDAAVARALTQLRETPAGLLLEPREVGAKKLPSTVIGLLFHAAEHAQRHAGQVVATAKFLSG